MSGHTGRGVIHDDNGTGGLVVNHVKQGIDTGMQEGGIAD